jgi:hypothetical protein
MIRAIKRPLAIRSYRNKLGPWLEQHYGWRASYSPQVSLGASTLSLATDPLCFAYAMFCTRSDFEAHHAATGESCDYDGMRAEIFGIESSGEAGWLSGDAGGSWFDSPGDSGHTGGVIAAATDEPFFMMPGLRQQNNERLAMTSEADWKEMKTCGKSLREYVTSSSGSTAILAALGAMLDAEVTGTPLDPTL